LDDEEEVQNDNDNDVPTFDLGFNVDDHQPTPEPPQEENYDVVDFNICNDPPQASPKPSPVMSSPSPGNVRGARVKIINSPEDPPGFDVGLSLEMEEIEQQYNAEKQRAVSPPNTTAPFTSPSFTAKQRPTSVSSTDDLGAVRANQASIVVSTREANLSRVS
jgi:hypothetical protein